MRIPLLHIHVWHCLHPVRVQQFQTPQNNVLFVILKCGYWNGFQNLKCAARTAAVSLQPCPPTPCMLTLNPYTHCCRKHCGHFAHRQTVATRIHRFPITCYIYCVHVHLHVGGGFRCTPGSKIIFNVTLTSKRLWLCCLPCRPSSAGAPQPAPFWIQAVVCCWDWVPQVPQRPLYLSFMYT